MTHSFDFEYGKKVGVFVDKGACRQIWDVVRRTECTDHYLPLSFAAQFYRHGSTGVDHKMASVTFHQDGSIHFKDLDNIWGEKEDKLLEEYKKKHEEAEAAIRKKAEDEEWSSDDLYAELAAISNDYPDELRYLDEPLVLEFKNLDEAMQDKHFTSLFDYPNTWWWVSHDHLSWILPILHARRNELDSVISLFEDAYFEKYHILGTYRRKEHEEIEAKYATNSKEVKNG